MLKFGRNYKMTIQVDNAGTELVVAYPLTLEFHIRRECQSSAGDASFRIYNLQERNRKLLYKPLAYAALSRKIKLEAGYGKNISVIFNGYIQESKSYRQEGQTNFITEITAQDYAPDMPTKISNWTSAPPDNTNDYVIRRIITQDLGAQIGAIGSFPGTYARNPSFCKPAWEALKTVTGGKCFVDNGKVFCLQDNDTFDGPMPKINSDSGLLGAPRMNDNWIIFDILFEPRLLNGQKLTLDSRTQPQFNGDYKVIGIEHTGVISGAMGGKCKTTVTLMIGNLGQ